MKDFPVYLGLGMAVLAGLGIFSLGARNVWRAFASVHWPTAAATVVESSLHVDPGTRRRIRSSDPGGGPTYSAHLEFQYEVSGHTYRTEQIYIGQTVGSGDSSDAELRRFRYPLGGRVTVSYQPSDPSIATVNPGFEADALWLPGAGLGFAVPCVMALFLFRASVTGLSGMGVGLAIFCLIFMTVGAVLLFFGGRSLWRGWRSPAWPTARGTIVYGRRDESQATARTGDNSTSVTTTYGTHLIFRYEVDGAAHFCNTRRFGQLSASSEEWADRIASQYPPGKEVTVWYRRDAPDIAVLEPGVGGEAWWAPGAGAAFLLFGLAALIFGVPALRDGPF